MAGFFFILVENTEVITNNSKQTQLTRSSFDGTLYILIMFTKPNVDRSIHAGVTSFCKYV